MSHLAAKKAPIQRLNQVPGAALQMQRELLWYKEVESIMPSVNDLYQNKKYEKSRILFTEEHRDLVKDGATWMKDTATQCMVVATLITTIMFAAVFTVPGANKDNSDHTGTGEPNNNYVQGKFPLVFVISNILALCSSVASMLMFLAIITSRYAEEDFLSTLPRMLMLGLLFLFVSIVGMMIAFVTAILFMLHYDVRRWASFPIIFLASVPVTIYALVELPLFIQLMFTTSSSDVFGKKNLNHHA
ncbi:ankyrin repeat-containing protein NPR4-like isoform X2 [Telopea speciosissima]|uniref:ankyrin repeat-containing protein NPR4-like isoform X2 n=1 Tax=Telopea speciosissima TaxID=54955 RepID=UPI001CC5BE4B|nr:ankyrin repeat-containing protein NPR4-like isoform X2 [Telopea speciosissima]